MKDMKKVTALQMNFIWKVCAAHFIAYFTAGILALFFLDYKTHFSSEYLSSMMKPVESPWVMLGPSFQLFRGIIIALVLLPVRGFIFEKKGFIKLAWLVLGFSFISTIGPAPGSFDGYIYTLLPVSYHLGAIPEALLYTVLFSGIISLWYKFERKYITIISAIFISLILFMSIGGFWASGKAIGV